MTEFLTCICQELESSTGTETINQTCRRMHDAFDEQANMT